MKIDALTLLIAYLRQQPELVDVPVSADLFGHDMGAKTIEVELLPGGHRAIRSKADARSFAINTFGPDKLWVNDMAGTVQEILLDRLPGTRLNDVVVSDVVESSAPYCLPDSVTGEERYLHLVSLFLYK